MILFYVDEAGDPHPHDEPLFDGQTPLFCLTGVAIPDVAWRGVDRALFGLKRTYFSLELAAFAAQHAELRPEHFEVKGTATSIYNHSLQVLTERFHHHCSVSGQPGALIADSRTKALDYNVAAGHLSFLFGHPVGRTYTGLVEAPLFADSRLSAGVQIADIVGACIHGNYYQRRCQALAGHVEGNNPISVQRFTKIPPADRGIRAPIRDYTHCGRYWSAIEALRFQRTDVHPPSGGNTVPGYYGFRELGS